MRTAFSILNNTKVWFIDANDPDNFNNFKNEIKNGEYVILYSPNEFSFNRIEITYDDNGDYLSHEYKPILIKEDGRWEPAFEKNTAFNKDFGVTKGTVAEGHHQHTVLTLEEITEITKNNFDLSFDSKDAFLLVRDELMSKNENNLNLYTIAFPSETNLDSLFENTHLVELPIINAPNVTSIRNICKGCDLTHIHSSFFKNKPIVTYDSAFEGNNKIVLNIRKDEGNLLPWENTRDGMTYENCFKDCTLIPKYDWIPNAWKGVTEITVHVYDVTNEKEENIILHANENYVVNFEEDFNTIENILELNTKKDFTGDSFSNLSSIPERTKVLYARTKRTFSVKFVDSVDGEVFLEKNVIENETYTMNIWDTAEERVDFLPVTETKGVINLLDIGEGAILSPDGKRTFGFTKRITEDMEIKCETVKFDYFINNMDEIYPILEENNYDLSEKIFGFPDSFTDLEGLFKDYNNKDRIINTPKIFYGRKIENVRGAFCGCSNLTNISTEIFYNCHNIKYIGSDIYKEGIFEDCTSIISIPVGIFDNCPEVIDFSRTFLNCTSLISIPEGLFDNCTKVTNFRNTFYNCSSLTSIPNGLFNDCIEVTSFYGLFSSCSSLTSIPAGLFDNCTKVTDFSFTFYNCSSLTLIPENLFINCTKVTSFGSCFSNCKSLIEIPSGLFDNCTEVTIFSASFYNCTSLRAIPEGLFDNCPEVTNFGSLFSSCTSLTSIPEGLFKNNSLVTNFSYTFYNCRSLTSIPAGLFDNCTLVTIFNNTFMWCSSLTSIPEGLFKNNTKVTNFSDTFEHCTSVTSKIPEAWITHAGTATSHSNYAEGCTKALNYIDIPIDWGGPITYIINFNVGEHANPIDSIKVIHGDTITQPEIVVNDGYQLEGWYTNSSFTTIFDFSTKIYDNITLYAKIIPIA